MNYVFISYSRTDKEFTGSVIHQLEYNGYECWVDLERIRFGKWTDIIDKAVKNSCALILILSNASSNSDWVKKEVVVAQQNGLPIIPLDLNFGKDKSKLDEVIWNQQRISVERNPSLKWVSELCHALVEEGIEPSSADPNDERLLLAREHANENRFEIAIQVLQELLDKRTSHLPAVLELIKCLYNFGRYKILDEEQRGLRPRYDTRMIKEYHYAEAIATHYIHSNFGPGDNEFRSLIWGNIGMISSFLGRYDDAIKRLRTSIKCDPNNLKSKEYLKTLLDQVSTPHVKNSAGHEVVDYRDNNKYPYPDPLQHSSWHSIAFTFTPVVSDNDLVCPKDVTDDWKRLWLVDHNISLFERELVKRLRTFGGAKPWQLYMVVSKRDGFKIELKHSIEIDILFKSSIEYYQEIADSNIAFLAAKRISKAVLKLIPVESDQKIYLESLQDLHEVEGVSKIKLNEFWIGGD